MPRIPSRFLRQLTGWLIVFLLAGLRPVPALGSEDEKRSPLQESIERREKAEILGFFLKDAKDAKMPGTAMAVGLYNQAAQYFQQSEYTLARQAAQDSLKQDDLNPLAYELLGDIDNFQQDLKSAKNNYTLAFQLQPTDRVRKKLEKLSLETQLDKGLSSYNEEHFIMKYNNSERAYEGFELREILREVYRNISQDFGYYFKNQIVVLIYDDQDFLKLTKLPPWVAGVYDGKVRMPINRAGFEGRDLKVLAAHEVTHAFVAAISQRAAPAWLNEGLAVYEENKIRKRDEIVFRSAVKTNTLFPLTQLISQEAVIAVKDPLLIELFYEQSLKLIEYLVDRYGMFRVRKLLEEFGKGKNSDEGIREILKISPERLEEEWKAAIPPQTNG